MKNVLIYSNMYPSKQKVSSGIFIKNEYELLREKNKDTMHLEILALERTFTGTGGSIKKYLSFMRMSLQYIFKNNFDIIHLHYFFPLAVVPYIYKKVRSKKNKPIKLILTVHGTDLYEKMSNKFTILLFKRILKSYDYIICVGNDMKHDFEQLFNIKTDRVLCAGIDKNVFYPLNIEKTIDFLFVGSVINRKGFETVLEVIKRSFNKSSVKIKWCVVGSGNYSNAISELADSHPEQCIYYVSKTQAELNELYNKAKWFFFPSRSEPFGLVVTEAIYTGTPVICSSNGGLKEQIIDKFNGMLLNDINDIDHVESIIYAAKNMGEDEYNKYKENCLKSNHSFSLQYVCDELTHLYEHL